MSCRRSDRPGDGRRSHRGRGQVCADRGHHCPRARRANATSTSGRRKRTPAVAAAQELASKTRRRQLAPVKVIDAIAAATTLPFDEGCRRERELFFECVEGEQAKALIHIFSPSAR